MTSSSANITSFRDRFSERLNRFRRKLPRGLGSTGSRSPQTSHTISSSVDSFSTPSGQTHTSTTQSRVTTDATHAGTRENPIFAKQLKQAPGDSIGLLDDVRATRIPPDLWSTAYHEAIKSLGNDIDDAIFEGSSATQLFERLEEIDKDAYQESAFRRGIKFLHSIQVPLENFKLALDLASPLSSLEPTVATVFGVVRSVTAIAITFASADADFANQIAEMLLQLQYIDECDVLGQKSNRQDIHKALVPVYRKVLEFYQVAHEVLTRRGVKLVMKMVLETDRIPNIVHEFLTLASALQKVIEKATLEVVEDIKAMLYDNDIQGWLGSDKHSLQSQYHAEFRELRTDKACAFLLEDPNFEAWYNASDLRWLLILGDTGCGKTIATSFIIDELYQRSKCQLPQAKVCYHYCRDGETGQASHVFAAMILSLLQQFIGLRRMFHVWYNDRLTAGFHPAKDSAELGKFLEKVVKTLDRPLFIVIDGLDECDRKSRKKLFTLLEELSQSTDKVKILLSSRPEAEILHDLHNTSRIRLSSNQQRDAIIAQHLVKIQLFYLADEVKVLVTEALSRLAQGSGIWTWMTVKLIEVRGIRAFGAMRLYLKELPLPDNLSALYTMMIERYASNDLVNMKITMAALKLIASAHRPLSIHELAWAVTLSTVRDKVSTVADLALHVDHENIMSLVHAFTTYTDSDDLAKRQIRLVHQSVKEFIAQRLLPQQDSSTESHQRDRILESFVLGVCVDYLLLDEIGKLSLFSEEQIAINELPQETDLFEAMDPPEYDPYCTWEVWEENMIRYDPAERGFGHFFVYAASHWLEHFSVVPNEDSSGLVKVETLCQAGSVRLDNWINQNCRPGCTIKARFEFDSRLYDPLSITSLYGSDSIFCHMLENSAFESGKFLSSSAIATADQILQWGDLARLRPLFLEDKFNCQLRNLEFFRLLIRKWCEIGARQHNWDAAFDIVDLVLDTLVQERWGGELLCTAVRAGCLPLIKRLLYAMQDKAELEIELTREPQSITDAVSGNHADVVECLLEHTSFETHLEQLNSHGESVLHLASEHCNPMIWRLLTPRVRKRARQIDDQGHTALTRIITSRAKSHDRRESARILLSSQSDAGIAEYSARTPRDPLQLAVESGDAGMCQILISDGKFDAKSVLTHDQSGCLVLKDEPQRNGKAILRLLRTNEDRQHDLQRRD